MRIIAGSERGRKLDTLDGLDTRPTLDRVRESLFNILQPYIIGACVLDLFAGSGALGLEAISRGASEATFVDCNKLAMEIVQKNIEKLNYSTKTKLFLSNWEEFLQNTLHNDEKFDIILLDPPYENNFIFDCLNNCMEFLSCDGIIVVEHNNNCKFTSCDFYSVIKTKKYGKVNLTFIKKGDL